MNPDVLAFAQVIAVIILSLAALSTIGVLTMRAIRKTKRAALPGSTRDDARLDQLQQSVEAIAVEVERIAEAQRFSARLLAERAELKQLPQ